MPAPYPFDPTGINPANKITNELVTVSQANGIDAYLIVPDASPFYGDSMVIIGTDGHALVRDVDYYLTHHWAEASDHLGHDIYGSISLFNTYVTGNYYLVYQTLGGDYVTSPANAIQSGLIASVSQYVDIDWTTAPTYFPALPHTETLSGLTGMTQLLAGISDISAALRSPQHGIHVNDIKGFTDLYIEGMMKPFLQFIEEYVGAQDAQDQAIVNIMNQLTQSKLMFTAPGTLQNYEAPLPGGLVVKVGYIIFPLQGEPVALQWNNPFNNQCIYVGAKLYFKDPTIPLNADAVKTGTPDKAGVPFTITYDPALTVGTRVLSYFAIGL